MREQHYISVELYRIIIQAIPFIGWIGLAVMIFCCVSTGWCGVLLGKCWMMLEERYPEYQDHCRDPYPSIGQEAFGKPARSVYACHPYTIPIYRTRGIR